MTWHVFHEYVKVKVSHTVMSDSLPFHGLQPVPLLCPWNSRGKSTGVGCHFLLQGLFLTQGSNLGDRKSTRLNSSHNA